QRAERDQDRQDHCSHRSSIGGDITRNHDHLKRNPRPAKDAHSNQLSCWEGRIVVVDILGANRANLN
ncbi:hypothetical protein, partial [Bradyrhizobium sp.]|uniref:hypothetical protein n=1 Tax=Bradyrhizobium sp. TaxID=376 RepID=UPI0029037542